MADRVDPQDELEAEDRLADRAVDCLPDCFGPFGPQARPSPTRCRSSQLVAAAIWSIAECAPRQDSTGRRLIGVRLFRCPVVPARHDEGRGQLVGPRLGQSLDLEGTAEQVHLLVWLER